MTDQPETMPAVVEDLWAVYRRDIARPEAQSGLEKLGLTDPIPVVDHFNLGFCTGKAVAAMSDVQIAALRSAGMISPRQRTEVFKNAIVFPVPPDPTAPGMESRNTPVDFCGLRPWNSGLRFVHQHKPHRGLIGGASLVQETDDRLILCDNPFHALHAVHHGYCRVMAIRSVEELKGHAALFERFGIHRLAVVSRQQKDAIRKVLGEFEGLDVAFIRTPSDQAIVPKACYAELVGEPPPSESSALTEDSQSAESHTEGVAGSSLAVKVVERTDARIHLVCDGTTFKLDSTVLTGLAMRVHLRLERDGQTFIDRADLASAPARRKLSRFAGPSLNLSPETVEAQLNAVARALDELLDKEATHGAAGQSRSRPRKPSPLTDAETQAARNVLEQEDVLGYLADALETHCGFVGEEANRRLAVLAATSRLLDQPLGAMLRGPAGSGKSALMQAVIKTLPPSEVLYFSRLTPQALYFLPPEDLKHKLLVCDEYEGLEDSEAALRTVMSSQTLSLAITIRESGRVPVTKTIEVPATLAVMVSTTGAVNLENLSRFIEIGMNASAEQTRRVMHSLANQPKGSANSGAGVSRVQHVNQLLRPCTVTIPYASQITYAAQSVLARRRFAQIVGLIAAHAALHQFQRPRNEADEGSVGIEATKADYAAIYPLLAHVVEHFEEDVSPPAMRLLEYIHQHRLDKLTRQEVMERMNWSYSQSYRVLKQLTALDLLVPDQTTNGVLRTYTIAPFFLTPAPGNPGSEKGSAVGITQITPPEALG